MLKIDNYKGIIHELLFESVFLLEEGKFFCEIFIEDPNISIETSRKNNYDFNKSKFMIRIVDIKSMSFILEKNIFKEVFVHFLNTNTRNPLNQCFLREMQSFYMTRLPLVLTKQEKSLISVKESKILKANEIYSFYQEQFEYKLIYKNIFLIRPKCLITVFYSEIKEKFKILIFNTKNCKSLIKMVELRKLKSTILNIKILEKGRMLNLIAERIVSFFKNQLMMEFLK